MKRKTLIRVNIIIALVAAALWFVPYPRGVNETWDAVAFKGGEAVGTTRITVDLNTNYYLFRQEETSGTLTIEVGGEPVVFDCHGINGVSEFPRLDERGNVYTAAYAYTGYARAAFSDGIDICDFYLLPNPDMIVARLEASDYRYIGFNGTYEEAADAFTELTAVLSLERLGFDENPFE